MTLTLEFGLFLFFFFENFNLANNFKKWVLDLWLFHIHLSVGTIIFTLRVLPIFKKIDIGHYF